MKQLKQIGALPLLKGKTVIIERDSVVKERTSIRSKFGDERRRKIKDLPQSPFALPDLLFCLLCFGDVHRSTNKLYEVARFVQDRMADNVDVLDGSVRKNNAAVCLIISLLDFASFKDFLSALPVVGMNPDKPKFNIRRIL